MAYDNYYYNARRQFYLERSHYDIAAAVLHGIAFLGGAAVTGFAFMKLRGSSVRHGFTTWLKLACAFFTLYCILRTCNLALYAPLFHQAATGVEEFSEARIEDMLNAGEYLSFISLWFQFITEGLLFIAIVAFCVATSTQAGSGSSRVFLVVAYTGGTVLNGLAAAVFALYVKQYRQLTSSLHRDIGDAYVLRDLELAFNCILSAAALFAVGLALTRLSKSMHIDGKPTKLAAVASALLLLAALYQLGEYVAMTFEVSPYSLDSPNYLIVLNAILDTWALLCSLALLFWAGKSAGGVTTKHYRTSAAYA